MNLLTYTDPAAYLQCAQPYLEEQEALNSLILGVTIRLRDRPDLTETPPYLATITNEAGNPLLVAAITPPHNLLASAGANVPQAALDLLVDNLRSNGWPVPGVNAENSLAKRIAQTWTAATGQKAYVSMRLRIYQLHQVIPPLQPPPGFLRLATLEDIERVTAWRDLFARESLHEEPPSNSRALSERAIQSETIYFWDDDGPVSMAARTRPTPHGESVGLVYTPPELRGHGYASACVAALSQRILDSGKMFCSLFTDLDFPTSNSIYQKIGYQPVCDFLSYAFA
jgi:uncharacterized protein